MWTKAKVALEARQNDFTYGTKPRPTSKWFGALKTEKQRESSIMGVGIS